MASENNKASGGSVRRILTILIAAALMAAVAFCAYSFCEKRQGREKAERVMSSLQQIIPGLGQDTGIQTGAGRDPLAKVSIEGLDIVGVLEIPSLDICAPVTGKSINEEYFAEWQSGSPAKGHFMLRGNKGDLFRSISKLEPGEKVYFTDIDGVRYPYHVVTQYHLKKWDEGDNDLLLCYESDDDTFFAVGCSAE